MEGLLLDAEPAGEGALLTVATSRGLERVRVGLRYRLYLRGPDTALQGAARDLERLDLPVEARLERWKTPPWYDGEATVLVLESPRLPLLERLARRLVARAGAWRVNPLPGPLPEALAQARLRPGWLVRATGGGLVSVGEPPPGSVPLRVARLTALGWHGPVAVAGERVERYKLECPWGSERIRGDPWEAVELLRSCRPHVLVARLEDVWGLPTGAGEWLRLDPWRSLVGLEGLLEWMSLSWLPWSMAHGAAIGRILTSTIAHEMLRERHLLDPRAPRAERFRTLRELATADMGGAGRIPVPGTYWGVVQLDYSSLYPRIIARYNISGSTVDRPGCTGRAWRCPAGHTVCTEPPSPVARVLGWLIGRRERLRRAAPERADAIKWILVSSFGYLGYRNSLYGSISAHECVTSTARKLLHAAEAIAERAGYRLVHSIVDSIFLQPIEPRVGPEGLARLIRDKTGIPVKVEALYTWLHIPPTLRGPGAAAKYYGLLTSGRVKLRGILAVRRDTPPLVARAQRAAIALLARAKTPREFHEAVEEAHRLIDKVEKALQEGRVHPRLLIVHRRIHKPHTRKTPTAQAARLTRSTTTAYIMTPTGPHPVTHGPPARVNIGYYVRLLEAARRELPATILRTQPH